MPLRCSPQNRKFEMWQPSDFFSMGGGIDTGKREDRTGGEGFSHYEQRQEPGGRINAEGGSGAFLVSHCLHMTVEERRGQKARYPFRGTHLRLRPPSGLKTRLSCPSSTFFSLYGLCRWPSRCLHRRAINSTSLHFGSGSTPLCK